MKRLGELDFAASRLRVSPWAALAIGWAVMAGAFMVVEWADVDALRDDLEHVEWRIGQRQRALEREQRRQRNMTPEEQRIDRLLAEQKMSPPGSGLPVIDWVEHAWTPEIALTALRIEKAGRQATLEGGAGELAHIYGFVDRLKEHRQDRKIGLRQQQGKVEGGRNVYHFSLSMEQT